VTLIGGTDRHEAVFSKKDQEILSRLSDRSKESIVFLLRTGQLDWRPKPVREIPRRKQD